MGEIKDKIVSLEVLNAAYDANKQKINKLYEQTSELNIEKIDKKQGTENYGKLFTVNSEGNVDLASFPSQTDVVYDETKSRLVITEKTNLPGNVSVDPLLLNEGDAADAKVTGDRFNKLSQEMVRIKEDMPSNTEIFTFTLEDGTEVVKEVYVRP